MVGKLKEAFSAVDGALKDVITISFATEKYDEKISGLKFDLDILEEKVKSIVAEKWTDTKKLYFVIIQVYAGASYEG